MRELIIYGAGGFGKEMALMIRQINAIKPTWKVVGYCDDNLSQTISTNGLPLIGDVTKLNDYPSSVSVVIAVANPASRKIIRDKIKSSRVDFPALIHPSAMLGDIEVNGIGEGSIVAAGNILTTNIRIGSFVIVNLSCTIGHDVVIDDYCSIMPGCSISGAVKLEELVQLGTGARILPGIKVGKNSRVGAGAVVTKDVPCDVTVVGVPARISNS